MYKQNEKRVGRRSYDKVKIKLENTQSNNICEKRRK